jgi:regulator of replication initiation timing
MGIQGTAIMRSFLATMIIVALLPCMLSAADITPLTEIPSEATALYAKLVGKVQPNVRPFINEQALKLRQGSTDPNAVSSSLDAIFSAAGIANMDVTEAAFIVIMQATKDMDEDIKAMMDEVKSFTSAKQKLRNLLTRVNQDVAKNANKKDTDVCAQPACGGYQTIMMEVAPVLKRIRTRTPLVLSEPINIGQLRSLADNLKGKLDGMNEMSEMTSLRLQMMMDRRSQFIITLSNMMKKISSTQDTTIQKIK